MTGTEFQETQRREVILALPVAEAIKEYDEAAAVIIENRGYDKADVEKYLSQKQSSRKLNIFHKRGGVTALSLADDIEKGLYAQLSHSEGKNKAEYLTLVEQINAMKNIRTKYQQGDKEPLRERLRLERDSHLEKIVTLEKILPPKNSHGSGILCFNNQWYTQSSDQKINSVNSTQFLDHVGAYLAIDRALKKEQTVVKS